MSAKPTVGSLFSGIGGLDLGLERAGWEVKWQVEIDPFCTKVLEKHWPDVKRYGDIATIRGGELEAVDLICGGFPCQPVSVAGKRKGTADKRWLWPEFHRIICEVRPRWALLENVPGLLSMDSGWLFTGILRDLATSGYDAEWDCIPASAFGAPHLRYRVFLVAFPQCLGWKERPVFKALQSKEQKPEGQNTLEPGEVVANTQGNQGRRIFIGPLPSNPGSEGDRPEQASWWSTEPDLGRVAHGVPARLDRLKALGNAVVPQVAEWIGRRILEVGVAR